MQSPSPLSRRHFLRAAGVAPLTLALPAGSAPAQEKQPAPALAPLNRFPRMVQEWYVEQVRAADRPPGVAIRTAGGPGVPDLAASYTGGPGSCGSWKAYLRPVSGAAPGSASCSPA